MLYVLSKVFPLLKLWGTTGLLIEYEDTFPYAEELNVVRAQHAYRYISTLLLNCLVIIIFVIQAVYLSL